MFKSRKKPVGVARAYIRVRLLKTPELSPTKQKSNNYGITSREPVYTGRQWPANYLIAHEIDVVILHIPSWILKLHKFTHKTEVLQLEFRT